MTKSSKSSKPPNPENLPPNEGAPAPASAAAARTKGRPRKGHEPVWRVEEVDRLLVFGELVASVKDGRPSVRYPTYRELAERFDVSPSLIAKYAREHQCLQRRKKVGSQVRAQADQKLIELRANAFAISKDDELRIIDAYLAEFEKALAEGRVRADNPADFNAMLRLKEFVLGRADARREVNVSVSLEQLQARHQQTLREPTLPMLTGEHVEAHVEAHVEEPVEQHVEEPVSDITARSGSNLPSEKCTNHEISTEK